MSDVNAYDELLQLERERDEAIQQCRNMSELVTELVVERDRLREDMNRIRLLDDYDHEFAAERAREIAREALAGTEDET
jgi:hypothetical protein